MFIWRFTVWNFNWQQENYSGKSEKNLSTALMHRNHTFFLRYVYTVKPVESESWINRNHKGSGFWCLTSLSTAFQLYRGDQLYWCSKLEYPEKNPPTCHKSLTNFFTSSTPRHERGSNYNISGEIGTDWIGSYKSNYHIITTTMQPYPRNHVSTEH